MMKPNLVVSCPASSRSGYGNHSRDLIRSLIKMDKYRISIIDQRWGACPRTELLKEEFSDIAALVAKTPPVQSDIDIWIQITVPNEFQPVGKYNIGITAGIETDRVAPQWLEGMNRMDLTLVPSMHSVNGFSIMYDKMNQQTNQKEGELKLEKPIHILMEGIDLDVYNKTTKIEPSIQKYFKDIKEDFCFLVCGHWMQGEFGHDRKDIGGTIQTFLATFKNLSQRNMPALILKTGVNFSVIEQHDYEAKIRKIMESIGSEKMPSIYLLSGDLTDSEMNSLYNHPKIKAMVSFTHGEGYGRPLAEFSVTGKPVIVSDWSGHKDFISANGFLIPGEVKPVHPSSVWKDVINSESQWFFPNYGYASGIMKDCHKNYKSYLEKSRKQTQYMKDKFSLEIMDEQFKNLLDENVPKFDIEIPKLEELQTYE